MSFRSLVASERPLVIPGAYDAILLDLVMPGLSGMETYRAQTLLLDGFALVVRHSDWRGGHKRWGLHQHPPIGTAAGSALPVQHA